MKVLSGFSTAGISVTLGLGIIAAFLSDESILQIAPFNLINLQTIDYRFQKRGVTRDLKKDGNVVIVEISDEDLRTLHSGWPVTRSYFANAVANLNNLGAQVIGVDVVFAGDRPGDDLFRRVLRRNNKVVLAGMGKITVSEGLSTAEVCTNFFFDMHKDIGMIDVVQDQDGVIRSYTPYVYVGENVVPTFALAIMARSSGLPPMTPAKVGQGLFILKDYIIPKTSQIGFLINFYGPARTFPYLPFSCLANDSLFHRTKAEMIQTLRNKIVLIGMTSHALTDYHLVPIESMNSDPETRKKMPPVEIHATVVQNILDDNYVLAARSSYDVTSAVLLTLATFWLLVKFIELKVASVLRIAGSILIVAILALVWLEISVFAFIRMSVLVNIIGPWIGCVLAYFSAFVYENRLRRSRTIAKDAEEKKRLSEEFRAARNVQMDLMPKEDPLIKGFDISGICLPSGEVGGDFFDYIWLDKERSRLGIVLADVSGKGMGAAMTAVLTSGMLYSESEKSKSPGEILSRINRPLYLRSDKRVFTALSFAVLDMKARKLTYSSAGQTNPIVARNGSLSYLKTGGVRLPLGLKEELQYKEVSVKLKKGEMVVFYTDGIPEAMNMKQEMYGFEQLERCIKNANGSARNVRDKILDDVRAFTGNAPQHDDMTVVVLKVL